MTTFERHATAPVGILVVGVLFATLGNGATAAAPRCAAPSVDQTVRRILALLPRRPGCVVVVDETREVPEVAEQIRKFDAFTFPGDETIYLRRHSPTFELAAQGSRVYQLILACVIWHEMAHLAGADEPEAQRQEEAQWLRFIREDRVSFAEGQAYLDVLRRRHRVTEPGPGSQRAGRTPESWGGP